MPKENRLLWLYVLPLLLAIILILLPILQTEAATTTTLEYMYLCFMLPLTLVNLASAGAALRMFRQTDERIVRSAGLASAVLLCVAVIIYLFAIRKDFSPLPIGMTLQLTGCLTLIGSVVILTASPRR